MTYKLKEHVTEEWKDIIGYEGRYQISNLGRVKSLKRSVKSKNGDRIVQEKIIKNYQKSEGYIIVIIKTNLKSKIHYIHRLIAEYFISNPQNKPCINHIDCNKSNNNIDNLEWCTYKENVYHAIQNGKFENVYKSANMKKGIDFNKHLRKPIIQKNKDGILIREWEGINLASNDLGLNNWSIIRTCKGYQKTCGGFIWEYAK